MFFGDALVHVNPGTVTFVVVACCLNSGKSTHSPSPHEMIHAVLIFNNHGESANALSGPS
jgi:hypothetical protein